LSCSDCLYASTLIMTAAARPLCVMIRGSLESLNCFSTLAASCRKSLTDDIQQLTHCVPPNCIFACTTKCSVEQGVVRVHLLPLPNPPRSPFPKEEVFPPFYRNQRVVTTGFDSPRLPFVHFTPRIGRFVACLLKKAGGISEDGSRIRISAVSLQPILSISWS
jgi:hypothetical protein